MGLLLRGSDLPLARVPEIDLIELDRVLTGLRQRTDEHLSGIYVDCSTRADSIRAEAVRLAGRAPSMPFADALVARVPLEALRSATLNPARFLAATDSLGTIESRKLADLAPVKANPLENIAGTRKVAAVVLNAGTSIAARSTTCSPVQRWRRDIAEPGRGHSSDLRAVVHHEEGRDVLGATQKDVQIRRKNTDMDSDFIRLLSEARRCRLAYHERRPDTAAPSSP